MSVPSCFLYAPSPKRVVSSVIRSHPKILVVIESNGSSLYFGFFCGRVLTNSWEREVPHSGHWAFFVWKYITSGRSITSHTYARTHMHTHTYLGGFCTNRFPRDFSPTYPSIDCPFPHSPFCPKLSPASFCKSPHSLDYSSFTLNTACVTLPPCSSHSPFKILCILQELQVKSTVLKTQSGDPHAFENTQYLPFWTWVIHPICCSSSSIH